MMDHSCLLTYTRYQGFSVDVMNLDAKDTLSARSFARLSASIQSRLGLSWVVSSVLFSVTLCFVCLQKGEENSEASGKQRICKCEGYQDWIKVFEEL